MIDSRNIFGGTTTQSATKFIYNAFTAAGWAPITAAVPIMARSAVSGALTANTLVDLLNESGSAGQIDQLSIFVNDTTARTIRIVITVDGTVILDVTSASISVITNGGGFWAGVGASNTNYGGQLPPIKYTNSIRIQYASSLTETGKFTTALAYQKVT